MFEAVLKSPATTAGHGGRDHCGRSSLLLSESCCESIPIGDGELVHRLDPLPGRKAQTAIYRTGAAARCPSGTMNVGSPRTMASRAHVPCRLRRPAAPPRPRRSSPRWSRRLASRPWRRNAVYYDLALCFGPSASGRASNAALRRERDHSQANHLPHKFCGSATVLLTRAITSSTERTPVRFILPL